MEAKRDFQPCFSAPGASLTSISLISTRRRIKPGRGKPAESLEETFRELSAHAPVARNTALLQELFTIGGQIRLHKMLFLSPIPQKLFLGTDTIRIEIPQL